ncbi:MAG: right-handed parallel beta-helix repeat-containing protein, partial [Planctomycetota bacterium]
MKTRRKLKMWPAMLVFLLVMVPTAMAGTIYVDVDASGADDGTSWADAYNYLQDALADANSGDEIWVAQGIYTPDSNSTEPNGSGDREATFQLISGVALRGGYAGDGELDPDARDVEGHETILSGDLKVLDGLTITGGVARGTYGGGMYNYEGNPTVLNCKFIENLARDGGAGMYNYNSSPTVINCRFIGNSAYRSDEGGGGMLNNWYSEPNIVSCTFIGNSAGWGGGIRNYEYSSSRMTNCDISENTAGYGGGLACGSNDRLTNCTISGNSATYGGGMLCAGLTSPTLDGCVISGNYASGFGGGMHNWWHSAPNLKNCTISGNSAGWGGGGVCNYEGNSILTNCTISGNYGYYGGGIYEHDVWSYIDTVVANCILWGNEAVYGPQINRKNS